MLESLITTLCINWNPDPKFDNACSNSVNAAIIQTHLKSNMDLLQHKVETEVVKHTGTDVWAASLTYYQMYVKQELQFSVPIHPIAESLSATLSKPSQALTFTWLF